MKYKYTKRLAVLIVVVLLSFVFLLKPYDAKDAMIDAEFLAEYVEKTHPYFRPLYSGVLKPPDDYYLERDYFLREAGKVCSKEEFTRLCRRYLSSLHDLHTQVEDAGKKEMRLGIRFRYYDGVLYTSGGNEVVQIGNASVSRLVNLVDQYFPYENESGRDINRGRYVGYQFIHDLAGIEKSEEITVVIKKGDIEQHTNEKYYMLETPLPVEYETVKGQSNFSFSVIEESTTAMIRISRCKVDLSFHTMLTQLKRELERGVDKLIIDLRDNPGGQGECWFQLFGTLGTKYKAYPRIVNYYDKESFFAKDILAHLW